MIERYKQMETLSNFQYMWEQWIMPLVDDLYAQLDSDFKESCNVRIRDVDKIRGKAEKYYLKKREEVKRRFYGQYSKGDSVNEHRMDFHKIGALICRTLIEYKVYNFDVKSCRKYIEEKINVYDTDWVVRNALINFRLAFYSSIVLLFNAMRFEYYQNNEKLYKRLCKKGKLDLYETKNTSVNRVKESFENCIVLDLAKRDIGNRFFDYFMYAIILYQLEEHNRNLLLRE